MVKSNRQYNFDLLRAVAAYSVIVLHFCEKDMFGAFIEVDSNSLADIFLHFIYTLSRPAVDVFIILSGFFLIDTQSKKIGKIVSLFAKTILFSEIAFLLLIVFELDVFSVKRICTNLLPQNYYLFLYSTVYLLSPYLNRVTRALSNREYTYFLSLLLVLFVFWPSVINTFSAFTHTSYIGVYTLGLSGTQMGFNIANFITLYYVGGYIKRMNLGKIRNPGSIAFTLYLGISLFQTLTCMNLPATGNALLYYDNLLVVFQSICLVVLFGTFKISGPKSISWFAARSYGVFLIHVVVLKIMNCVIDIKDLIDNGFAECVLYTTIAISAAYLFSCIFDYALSVMTKPIQTWWCKTKYSNFIIGKFDE